MYQDWIKFGLLSSSVFLSGCAGSGSPFASRGSECPLQAQPDQAVLAKVPTPEDYNRNFPIAGRGNQFIKPVTKPPSQVKAVSYQSAPKKQTESSKQGATLTSGGTTSQLQFVDTESDSHIQAAVGQFFSPPVPAPPSEVSIQSEAVLNPTHNLQTAQTYPLDLPTALAMVAGEHPAVGFANWKVQEAYAQLEQAEVMWLPSLQAGVSFHRHDGNYQASNGGTVDVNRSSFQYGFGSGAVGAGTTPRPGLVAQFHAKDALFQPRIAEKTAWARGHAATGVLQRQLLDVALAYLKLLREEQDLKIVEESENRTEALAQLTEDFASSGQGLRADADRMKTELALVKSRIAEIQEQSEVASSRLALALSLDANHRIVPLDPMVVPIELVTPGHDKASLIATGLSLRPKLKEAQALVAEACERYQREKYSPFVPSVLLGLSTTGFGGGVGTNISNTDGRYDFDALMTWEVRNLGLGEKASRREMTARVEQAKFEKIRVLDQVAQEISESHSQVVHRANRMEITKNAIQSAEDSFKRNLSRIRDGQGLPIEVLQSIRALEDARRAYLKSVIDYNEAQFKLQWAIGWSGLPASQ
ncbi:TolC family protein [bacterium]|jgi:outer membrane protein TolC|nr:TolC family protein [bacterium]